MGDVILNDLAQAVSSVFKTTSSTTLIILVLIGIMSGLRLKSVTELFPRTVQGLLGFGFVLFLIDGFSGRNPFSFETWQGETIQAWNALMSLSIQSMLGYAVAVGGLSLAVFLLKRFIPS